ADLVPGNAGLRVIAVGGDLHDRARAVLVVPAQAADELLLPAITPQLQLVRLDRCDAKLRRLAGAHALGPGIAVQRIGHEAKVIRLPRLRRHAHALGAEAGLGEGD